MSDREHRRILIIGLVLGAISALAAIATVVVSMVVTDNVYVSLSRQPTVTQTVTEPAPGGDAIPPAPTSVGLTQLNEEQDVQFAVEADFSARNIAGQTHTDAVTGLVYPDGSGFDHLTIESKGRFTGMTFTVGIDSEAECSQARAEVSIQNEAGAYLWGPQMVSIQKPRSATISIPSPVQVVLKQISLAGDDACGNGEAQVSWGGVVFTST